MLNSPGVEIIMDAVGPQNPPPAVVKTPEAEAYIPKQVVVPNPPACPAYGTILSTYCVGVDEWAVVADGVCGSFTQLNEANSLACGYVPPPPYGTILSTYCVGVDEWAVVADGVGGTFNQLNEANSVACGYVPWGLATFDPAAKNVSITLSNGNLTASCLNSNAGELTVLSTVFMAVPGTEKKYCEFTYTRVSGNTPVVGIAPPGHSVIIFVGGTVTSYGHEPSYKWNGGAPIVYDGPIANGDVISVLLDSSTGVLSYWRNGVDLGPAFTVISGSYCPAITLVQGTASFTANFGATPWIYTPPVGYIGW